MTFEFAIALILSLLMWILLPIIFKVGDKLKKRNMRTLPNIFMFLLACSPALIFLFVVMVILGILDWIVRVLEKMSDTLLNGVFGAEEP